MTSRAATLAILLIALAPQAKADAEGEALLRRFVDFVDASPSWSASVGSIRSDGSDTIGEGLVFSHSSDDATVAIERMTLSALSESDGGGVSTTAIKVEGTTLTVRSDLGGGRQTLEYTIPSASAADLSFPNVGDFVFDPQRPLRSLGELYTLIAQSEFRDFDIPEVTGRQSIIAEGVSDSVANTFTYKNLHVAGMADGVLGETQAGPMSMNISAPDGSESVHVDITEVAAGTMDVGAIARIFDPRAYENGRGDGVWRPIMTDVTYSGISATGPDGMTFRIGRVAAAGGDGRQPDEPFADKFDSMLATDFADADAEDASATLDALLSVYKSWRLASFEMEGLSLSVPKEQTSFQFDRFSLSGLSPDGLDNVTLTDMRGSGPEAFVSLNSFELVGLLFPDLMTFIEIGKRTEEDGEEPTAQDIRAMMEAMPRIARFALGGIVAGPNPADSVTVNGFTIDVGEWIGLLASSTDIRLDQMYIPNALLMRDPEAAEPIRALGFERLVLSVTAGSEYSMPDSTFGLKLWAKVENGAEITITCVVAGIADEWLERFIDVSQQEDEAAMMELMSELSLVHASITIADQSLVDRAFKAAIVAQKLEVDVPTYKQQTREALPFLMTSFAPEELAQRISAPVQDFLGGGKTIVAEIAPAEPVPLLEILGKLQDPAALADQLELSITTE